MINLSNEIWPYSSAHNSLRSCAVSGVVLWSHFRILSGHVLELLSSHVPELLSSHVLELLSGHVLELSGHILESLSLSCSRVAV